MEQFRVFNDVARVGVDWRIGDVRFQIPSMSALMVVLLGTVGLVIVASGIGGTVLAVIVAIVGVFVELGIYAGVSRLNSMSRVNDEGRTKVALREVTQVKLLLSTTKDPVYKNFSTPDADGGSSVYKNY